MRKNWIGIVLTMGCMVAGAGCMTSPRDATAATATNQTQEFSGYVPTAGGNVTVEVKAFPASLNCDQGTWETFIAKVPVATTASFTDDCGQAWYAWKTSVPLKNAQKYWCNQAYATIWQAQYRAKWGGSVIASFSSDAETTCKPARNCGSDVINTCGHADGVARIICATGSGAPCQIKF